MHSRRKREKGCGTLPTTFDPFRTTERLFKDRRAPPRTELALDFQRFQWDSTEVNGKLRGIWTSGNGEKVLCYRVTLEGLGEVEMGQSRWKGKGKATAQDYAIVIPRIPGKLDHTHTSALSRAHAPVLTGLVFFPSILPEPLQRSLVVESLQNARRPNVTSLDPHYKLPAEGLWNALIDGKGAETVESIEFRPCATSPSAEDQQIGSSMSSSTNSLDTSRANTPEPGAKKEITIRELVPKLRWANVGYHYNVCLFLPLIYCF